MAKPWHELAWWEALWGFLAGVATRWFPGKKRGRHPNAGSRRTEDHHMTEERD